MSAHQCPRCPLLFTFRTELEWHLAADHPAEESQPPADRSSEPAMPDPGPPGNKIPAPT
jgi:hypothetical protein